MSAPRPYEAVLLTPVEFTITDALGDLGTASHNARIELVASVGLATFGDDRKALDAFVRGSACAGDLSLTGLRGVRPALASLAKSIASVEALTRRRRAGDSPVGGANAWRDVAHQGFDLVI